MGGEVVSLQEEREKGLAAALDRLVQLGAYEQAIERCNRFIAENPASLSAYAYKHEIHMNIGSYEESLEDANQIIASTEFKKEGFFLKLLSLTQLVEGRPRLRVLCRETARRERAHEKELASTAGEASSLNKGDTQIACAAAEAYVLLGRREEAVAVLQEQLDVKPWDVHCLFQLGLIFHEAGELEQALAYYDRSLESVENYSDDFRENFSELILQTKEELLEDS